MFGFREVPNKNEKNIKKNVFVMFGLLWKVQIYIYIYKIKIS